MPTAQQSNPKKQQANAKQAGGDNKIANAVAKVQNSEEKQQPPRKTSPSQQPKEENSQGTNSNNATGGNRTPQDQPEFIKQSLILIEKKVRNLEKRRIKLDEYKAAQKKGEKLLEDQLAAVERYDEVTRTLELARELEKSIFSLANDAVKQQKKQAKKEQLEREEAIRDRLRESHKILSVLNVFGDETVRNDFLNEQNGASKLTQEEISYLDEFNRLVQVASELGAKLDIASSETSEHLYNLIEAKNKPIQWSISASSTYSELRKLFDRILSSSYWNKKDQPEQQHQQQPETPVVEEQPQQIESSVDQNNLVNQVNNLNLSNNDNQHHHHHHQQDETQDDYVLVNSNEFVDNQHNMQQPGNAKTPFFSTLNPAENTRGNINEFLNQTDSEAINFLQDSELQKHELEQQQQGGHHHDGQSQHQQQHHSHHHGGNRHGQRGGGRGNGNYQNRPPRQYQDGEQRRSGGGSGGHGNGRPPRENGNGGGYRGPRGGNTNGGSSYRGGNNNYNGPRNNNGQAPSRPYNNQNAQVA